MTNGNRRFNNAGTSAGVILLSAAIAIVVAYALNNWWLLVPIFMLELGAYVIIISLSMARPVVGAPWTKSDSNFYMFWGNLLAVIGLLLLLNTYFPGNVIILVVVFIVWFGVFALLYSVRGKQT
jgi:hypothetical protein